MTNQTDSIQLGEPSPYMKGVAAGAQADEQIAGPQLAGQPYRVRLAWYWLVVGRASAEFAGDDPAAQDFVAGASLRQPLPPPAGITLTREQVQAWVGCALDDPDVAEIGQHIPNSPIPEAIAAIAHDAVGIPYEIEGGGQ